MAPVGATYVLGVLPGLARAEIPKAAFPDVGPELGTTVRVVDVLLLDAFARFFLVVASDDVQIFAEVKRFINVMENDARVADDEERCHTDKLKKRELHDKGIICSV